MSNIDDLFAGMSKADINGSGTYMGEGQFVVETKNIFVKKGMNPKKPGDSFICEFTIVESDNEAHKVGSTGSFVLKFTNTYAMGNIAELVIALLGYENTKENQKNETIRQTVELVTRAACGSEGAKTELEALRTALENPNFGNIVPVRLKLETKKKPTEKGGQFTVHKWSPLVAIATA